MAIIEELGYSIFCACWVPRMQTDAHKETRKAIATDVLHQYSTEGEGILSQIVTGDEICVHCFDPKSKQKLMEWHHMTSSRILKEEEIHECAMILKSHGYSLLG
jgi:hypothetical protein